MSKNGKSISEQKNSALLISILVAFFCGALTATIIDFKKVQIWLFQQIFTPNGKIQNNEEAVSLPKPQFEFYNLLGGEVNSQMRDGKKILDSKKVSALSQNSSHISEPTSTTNLKNLYVIQLASFRRRQEAERMKVEFILKGFDVQIIVASRGSNQWFRVVVGPFNSKPDAEKNQIALASREHIKGLVFKIT